MVSFSNLLNVYKSIFCHIWPFPSLPIFVQIVSNRVRFRFVENVFDQRLNKISWRATRHAWWASHTGHWLWWIRWIKSTVAVNILKKANVGKKKVHISLMQLVMKGKLDLDYFHQSSQRRFTFICDDISNSSNECKLICRGWMVNGLKEKKSEKLPTFRWMVKRKSGWNGSFKRKRKEK